MRRISWLLAAGLLVAAGCGPKRLPPVTTEPGAGVTASGPGAMPLPHLLGVGLAENETEFVIAATGPADVLDAVSGRHLARLLGTGRTLTCRRRGDDVAWFVPGQQGTAPSVRLAPVDPDHRAVHGDDHYRGELLVIPTPGSRAGLTLINDVELEAYLRGVVPWEIGRQDREKLAALEAQAVAARTYTVSHLGARRDHGFDVFADVMDQVYRGARDEDPLCNEAIASTAGLVLRHGGVEIEAYYSACCGGVSSQVDEVWPRAPRPYLVSRRDGPRDGEPWCTGSRHFHWRESWEAGELEVILSRTLPEYLDYMAANGRAVWAGPTFSPRDGSSDPGRPGGLRDLEILRRTVSGRVADLAVTTDAGTYHVRGDRVRWVLEPASGQPVILRSALFDLELERVGDNLRRVAVRGRGFGHGIGMCQTGALEMARRGFTCAQILAHYYPGSLLTQTADAGP